MPLTPYFQRDEITIYHGRGEDILPQLGRESVDTVFTDPPYGVGAADWDGEFPEWWLPEAAILARQCIAIQPGIENLMRLPQRIGHFTYRWMLSAQLSFGKSRGVMGFANWIPTVVYAREGVPLCKPQRDCASLRTNGDRPDHPTPKPLSVVMWSMQRLPGESILDPFMGSGTSLVAALQLGRAAIGVEREERHCEEAANRLSQGVLPLTLAA